jgi:CheY-like chemotaxis protein
MELIFEEFAQIPSPMQRRVKGTGLGLPLCRRMATLLGGEVSVESVPGQGSTFFARLPMKWSGEERATQAMVQKVAEDVDGPWVLIVEDDAALRLLYEKFLVRSGFAAVAVDTLDAARRMLETRRPSAVILDILLDGEEEHTWRWLSEMKALPRPLPVVVVSNIDDPRKAYSLGADAYFNKPVTRDDLLAALRRLTVSGEDRLALIIDDDDAARYVIRKSIPPPMRFEEARDGPTGLALAATCNPSVIFLDLSMPGMRGDEVLAQLRTTPATAGIPVIIVTSHDLDAPLRERLQAQAHAIMAKKDLTPQALLALLGTIEGFVRRDPGRDATG